MSTININDIVQRLVKDKQGVSKNEYQDKVNLLLEYKRVDPSGFYNIVLDWATEKGHLDIVDDLLEERGEFN